MIFRHLIRKILHLPGRVSFMFRLVWATTIDQRERWFEVFPVRFSVKTSQRIVNGEALRTVDVQMVDLAYGYEGLGYLTVFFTFIEGLVKVHGLDGVYIDNVTDYKLREYLFKRKYSKDEYFQLSMIKRIK